MPRFLIGIDLGTTNSALAYVDAAAKFPGDVPSVKSFAVPQHVALGEVDARPLLPSFLYLPGEHELPAGACALPWDPAARVLVGELARKQGAVVPGRLVTSAKSWLCHGGVDREAAILPWGAPSDVVRISPVEASRRLLLHLAKAWNYVRGDKHAGEQLEDQAIVLTVPASFDDVARNLTAQAARQAGIRHLTLLEEPQAAFYAWMAHQAQSSHQLQGVQPGMRCLVIDVGGGTTDFSLIEAVADEGTLGFVRRAVGDHLLLGGDNMDLTLARQVESRLPAAGRLDAARFAALTQACRQAKERLLNAAPSAEEAITVMGRGRAVVGGTLTTHLSAAEVQQLLCEGFFPAVPFDAEPERKSGLGLQELGLPYVADPAITKHLAAFLRQHGVTTTQPPDAILFNGGVFQSARLRDRLLEVMHGWFDRPGQAWQPIVLTSPSLDLAVALGAAYYGWLRLTGGRRISAGLARSYYLGVQTAPDQPPAQLCVVPQDLQEGQEVQLAEPVLELALGQPVQFPLWTSTLRAQDRPGTLLHLPEGELLPLSPLQSVLRGGKRSGTKLTPVTLAARLTEIGTLELSLVARNSPQRWRLEFNIRAETSGAEAEPAASAAVVAETWPEDKVQAALQAITFAFQQAESEPLKRLTKQLEDLLEASRWYWPTTLCRRLADHLLTLAEQRQRSSAHLSRWLQLTGFVLRPGFGEGKDRFRVEQLWKTLTSPLRQAAGTGTVTVARGEQAGTADTWILWRRVAGGLSSTLQQALWERLKPGLLPGRAGSFRPPANELIEMWRTAGSLERLDLKVKEILGSAALKALRRPPYASHLFWALARLGGRKLLYGPLNAILPADVVEQWLQTLLTLTPEKEPERSAWCFALANLARRTQQRSIDVAEDLREAVLQALAAHAASERLVQMVREGGDWGAETPQLFGEQLPVGLRLVQ